MKPLLSSLACAFAAILLATQAMACGVCVEDRMAATYDDAVVRQAASRRHWVVFCEVKGVVSAEQLRAAAQAVPGVDPRSIRTSLQPAALSFSLDPARQTPEGAVDLIATQAGRHVQVELLKTMAP
ncbi:hypothetical protein N8I74_16900 [Chitiniphilus purpureus]|uniref:HMA domain-containing protein n=1 Tax=Chitiniphilus purpureus TaxID=2981137 RepID=A0ABY6DPF5_9NEIS|nr:hypothetical protein [Chitiniphilus sp. CD1]UXY14976.1 hypothetical protein N8I74_16900 [Chitiniphilus sp. CD1]